MQVFVAFFWKWFVWAWTCFEQVKQRERMMTRGIELKKQFSVVWKLREQTRCCGCARKKAELAFSSAW